MFGRADVHHHLSIYQAIYVSMEYVSMYLRIYGVCVYVVCIDRM